MEGPRLLDYIVAELYGCTFGLHCASAERSQILLFDGIINVFERSACFPFLDEMCFYQVMFQMCFYAFRDVMVRFGICCTWVWNL